MEYFSMRRNEADFGLSIPPPVTASRADAVQKPLYTVRWERDGAEHRVYNAPWDTCYLIGGRSDSMGAACLPPAEIYQMVAEYIFLVLSTPATPAPEAIPAHQPACPDPRQNGRRRPRRARRPALPAQAQPSLQHFWPVAGLL